MKSCDARNGAYKNGKTFEQCKEIAKEISLEIGKKISEQGVVNWTEILTTVNHDELVYKLTLKYLKQAGYDIGDWKNPKVTRINV